MIDPDDFTIDLAAAAAIDTALASGDVTVETTNTTPSSTPPTVVAAGSANAAGNGDIFVESGVSWTSQYGLTLEAYRNIEIDANVTHSGTATQAGDTTLTLSTENGPRGTGVTGLTVGSSAEVTLLSTNSLTINGTSYTLITGTAG